MYYKLLQNPSFHSLLMDIDRQLSEQYRLKRCPFCNGPLHLSNYSRSPLGLKDKYRDYYSTRYSLCCGHCRKRVTTKSVRFFGRRRFPAPVFILISMLKCKITQNSLLKVRRYFGVNISKRTWTRWCKWWRTFFTETKFWKWSKSLLHSESLLKKHPRSLLLSFDGTFSNRLILILKFLSPMTAGIYQAV